MTTPQGLAVSAAHDAAQARLLDRGLAEVTLLHTNLVTPASLATTEYAPLAAASLSRTRAQASAVAQDFYGVLRAVETGSEGIAAPFLAALPAAPPTALLETSMAVTGPISVKGSLANGATMQAALENSLVRTLGAATRHIEGGPRDVTRLNASTDPLAGGWSRRSGGSPCSFCAMLIGRGPVYFSEGSGSFRAHDHCHCKAVTFFGTDTGWTAQASEFREVYDRAKKDGVPFDKAYKARYGTHTARPDRVHSYALLVDERRTATLAKSVVAEAEAITAKAAKATVRPASAFKSDELVAALDPSRKRTAAAVRADLEKTAAGKDLAEVIKGFTQTRGGVANLRANISKALDGGASGVAEKRTRAFLDALNSYPTERVPSLFRGFAVKVEDTDEWWNAFEGQFRPGQKISLNASSFTSSEKKAAEFGRMIGGTKQAGRNYTQVRYVLEGETHALPVEQLSKFKSEKEWMTGGEFEVVDYATATTQQPFHRVVIRQTKSLEAPPRGS